MLKRDDVFLQTGRILRNQENSGDEAGRTAIVESVGPYTTHKEQIQLTIVHTFLRYQTTMGIKAKQTCVLTTSHPT